MGGVAVSSPPVEASDEFTHLEAEFGQLESRPGGGVAADAIAVADVGLHLVQGCGGFDVDLAVREVDCAGDVLLFVGEVGATVYDDDWLIVLEGFEQVRGVGFVGEFVAVEVQLVHRFGWPF